MNLLEHSDLLHLNSGLEKKQKEITLIVCCSRSRLESRHIQIIEALSSQPLDWNFIYNLTVFHGILPLVFRNLIDVDRDTIPGKLMVKIETLIHSISAKNRFLSHELGTIMSSLEAAGSPAIAYKGPALAKMAYGDVGLRMNTDLDVLIDESDFLLAERALTAIGYTPDDKLQRLQGIRKRFFLYLERECTFEKANRLFKVDLHTGIGPRRFYRGGDFKRLLDRSDAIHLEGRPVRSLSPEDHLHVLCYHGTKHRWEHLKLFCDIAEIVEAHPDLDWDEVVLRATATRRSRMVYLGLYLASSVLNLQLPPDIQVRIDRHKEVKTMAREMVERLFRAHLGEASYGSRLRFHLWAHDSLRGRIGYCANAVFLNSWSRKLIRV